MFAWQLLPIPTTAGECGAISSVRTKVTNENCDSARRRSSPFVPLRDLLRWGDADAKKKEAEKEARDDASDLIRITNQDLAQTRTEIFFFLAAILFVAITTLSIADRDLLFGSRVQLP